jgi:predicted enzyme related to lactoylglutathione lyase
VLRLSHITFACAEPRALAAFWADVLGYEPQQRGEDWAAVPPSETAPDLLFRSAPKSPTIEVPIHLDVNVPDREREVDRLVSRGAKIVVTKTDQAGELVETFTVMRDPEGNGFCVQGPDERRAHPYLGNITFSCAAPRRLVGPFWSQALGWPEHQIPSDFLQMLREANIDVDREFDGFYAIRSQDPALPRLLFQRREKSRPAAHPLHLDLIGDDREADAERLLAAGATLVERRASVSQAWIVLRDPEGTPFCVF